MLDTKLITFQTVAELKSYTKAAEILHITQPAVTQHIHKLEEYYGCKLIQILGKSIYLTPAGEVLNHYISIQQTNELQLLERLKGVEKPFYVGATLSIADYYLSPIILEYLKTEENNISLLVQNTHILLEKLITGELDCAFIEGIFDTSLFESHVFCTTSFVPVVSSTHPLANQKVTLQELTDYPLILRENGSGTRAILENYLTHENTSVLAFKKIIELGSFSIIKKLLSVSHGITFLYENVVKKELEKGELSILSIEDFSIIRPLYFIYLKNNMSQKKYLSFFEHYCQ